MGSAFQKSAVTNKKCLHPFHNLSFSIKFRIIIASNSYAIITDTVQHNFYDMIPLNTGTYIFM